MKFEMAIQLCGDACAYDADEDAPMLTLQFHNELRSITPSVKLRALTAALAEIEHCMEFGEERP